MITINTTILIGNLASDPTIRYTNTGKAVTTMTIAVNKGFGKDNEADFIPVVVWEKQAENCANYLTKGSKVGVLGRIQVRSYEANDGSKRYVTEVVAQSVEFLNTKQEQTTSPRPAPKPQKEPGIDELEVAEFETMEDTGELPF